MAFAVTMPKLSPTMEEGTIAKWHKSEGEYAEAGELLFEVATDKATIEYNVLDSGWVRKILVNSGQIARVNQPVAIFSEKKDDDIKDFKPKQVQPESAPKDQAEAPPTSEVVPKAQTRDLPLQQPLFVPEPPLESYQFERPTEQIQKRIAASPLAKKLAKERGLDLTSIKGSGPGNRIVSKDLDLALPETLLTPGSQEAPQVLPGTFEEETPSQMRKTIAKRLQESKSFIPHFYVQQTVDAQPLAAMRDQLNQVGIKVSINDLIVRGVALALRKHPQVNSGYNSANQTIIRFKTIDISIAVNMSEGLITPIVRHADFKSVLEISTEVRYLAKRAKEGGLEPHEYKGGSFTVSNLGMFGVSDFQAIINPPQAAILAVSAIQDSPVIKNGAVVAGKTINLSLSADHRVVDGVAAAEFMRTLKTFLENPASLLI